MTASPAPLRIDIASDVVCPWCIIGYLQLEAARKATGVALDIHWHPFELNPEMPAAGENLRAHIAAKYGSSPQEGRAARAKLTALGAALGFDFDYFDEMRMVNTFAAHRLMTWAETLGAKHKLKMALFAAYFSQRRDVSDAETLVEIAADLGLDPEAAARVLRENRYAGEVRDVERAWIDNGISGVPAMIFAGRHLVTGAQGVETYTKILQHLTLPEGSEGERGRGG
ncbi:MAG: DsbA family oxidoreductase [Rhodospirillales bacterium]